MTKALDTIEAAALLGISKYTLERLRYTGGGPIFVKIGARVTYEMDDLIAWRNSRKRRSTSDTGESQHAA